ncbi:MAG: glycosyltransferase family 4 protein, partial [Armatimonadetes bacterium]|nr:glycosyltransferase family 4 protein [Armatimonadota bacterium]
MRCAASCRSNRAALWAPRDGVWCVGLALRADGLRSSLPPFVRGSAGLSDGRRRRADARRQARGPQQAADLRGVGGTASRAATGRVGTPPATIHPRYLSCGRTPERVARMVSPMKGHDIGQGLSVLQVLRPAAGGMLRHVADLCDGMGRRGIRCTVAGPRGVLDALGVAVPNTVDAPISASANPVLDMRAVLRVARAARAHDLIHAHGLRGAWIGSWAALLVRRPMVMSAHNVPEARSVLRRFALTRSVRTAHTVVAVSEAVAAGLSKCGVPRERITVLPNGVAWRPAPDRDTLGERRLQLSVDAEAFMVAAAGRLSPEKGFDVLVAAAPAVVAGCSGAHIAICGAGPERERLE